VSTENNAPRVRAARDIAAPLAVPRVLIPSVIVAVTVAWVLRMPRTVLMGDDLSLVVALAHVKWPDALGYVLTNNGANKYRPVLTLIFTLIVPAFGAKQYLYIALNAVVEIAAALTLSVIALRLTCRNAVLAALAGSAFIVSRFSYYNFLQIPGLMESVTLLLMLLAVRSVVIAYQDDRPRALWATVWIGLLAIFTDERYFAIVPFLVAAPLLHPSRRAHAREMLLLALSNCAGLAVYALIKTFIFRTTVATGTGGNELHPQASGVLLFLRTAVANMLGFNAGDPYYSGRDLSDLGLRAYVIGALVCVPLLVVAGFYVYDLIRRRAALVPLILGLVLFVPLLLTTTVTVRQEFRWLYGPFALVVLGLVAAHGRRRARSLTAALTAFALLASIGGAIYYRQFVSNVFFIHGMVVAGAVRDAMLRDPSGRVVLATHYDSSFQGWVFQNGAFFTAEGLDISRLRFVNEVEEAADEAGRVTILSAQMTEAGAERVDIPRVQVVPFANVRLSFESQFRKGVINSSRAMRTPGGRGVFLFPYPGEPAKMSSLTVLPNFRYTFRNVTIAANEQLVFYVAQPIASGAPSRAFVSITGRAGSRDVFSGVVEPSVSEPAWRRIVIPLAAYAGQRVEVTFGADPTNTDTSAWVAFVEPSLVVAKP